MHIYKPLTKPTAVSHSLTCHFTGEDNLITVKGNSLLQIFRITTITSETIVASTEETDTQEVAETGEDTFIGTEIGLQTADERSLSKLILICEVPLDGYVTDIGSIRSSLYHSKDILILSFKHAKMVLLIWDEEKFCTTPISVHYYEKDLFDSHFADPNYVSRFKTEPLNTCLCLMYQKDQMAFLPFYRDESLDDGNTKGSNPEDQPIYSPSFALPVSRLDESISHVIDFAFLYEYREPTIAIVFQPVRTWTGTIPLHKDTVRYLVMSLDLQQRSSTTITSVSKLPFDINQILPLPSPLGGSLLIGANHVLHIDTSGKVKGVAVNKFSELITEQSLDDHQDDLDLRLEGCKAVYLKECDQVLMTLQDGRLFTVKFLIEGRKIFKLTVSPLPILENGAADGLIPHPSSMSSMKNRTVFIGSSTSDAHLLGWTIKGERSLPSDGKVAVANEHGDETDQDKDNGDDLDDIYGEYERDDTKVDSDVSGISKKDLKFYIHDSITNYGPINSLCIGSGESHTRKEVYNIVTATGSGHSGGISIFQNSIDPVLISSLNLGSYDRIWTFASNSLAGETMGSEEASIFDTHVITSSTTGTKLYKIGDKFEKVTDTDFKLDSSTREIFVANNGTLIIQILEKKIVLYTSDFTVLETVKLETIPIDAKFQDPYILLLTKKSYTIHEVRYIGGKANLKQVKIPAPLNKSFATISLGTTSLLNQTKPQKKGVKRKRGKDNRETDELISTSPVPVGTMMTKQGDLEIFQISNPDVRVTLKGLTYLPSTVDSNTPTEFTRNPIDITELILASLGDVDSCEEYIIFLTSSKELYMYRTFLYDGKPKLAKVNENSYSSQLRSAYNEIASEDDTNESEDREEEELIKEKKLQDEHTKNGNTEKIQPHLHNYGFVGTYRGIVLSGECPAIILRGSQTCPIIHQLATGPFKAFTLFSTDFVYKGFAYLNKLHKTNLCILNEEVDYDCQFPARRICLGENVNHVAYHSKSNVYLVSTSKEISYQAVDEDEIPIPGLVEGLPKGTSFQGSLKLISPFNWTVIDELELAENEVIMCLKTMLLEVSEKSKRRNELIVFGTSVLRGEDLASKGSYYVYDAIDIIPEPGKPQTNRKLKELAKESLKGAITAICEVSGYLVVGQGQKVVVRNVQEDNTVIPVAFCDLSMYVSEAKSIKNLLILGDGLRSVWLVGFALEPYRMTVIAKDLDQIKVISSEFVTNNGNLYIVVADADKTLHLFQYDPDDPNSSGGQRLIKKSHFFIGKELRSSILVNMHSTGNEELIPLCGADDGSLSTVIPLEESSYRALFVMQEQIIDKEEHNACLNPRMYRNLGLLTAQERSLSRFLLDYNILQKFFTLDVQKKYNYSRKLGRNGEGQVWDSLAKVDRILDYI